MTIENTKKYKVYWDKDNCSPLIINEEIGERNLYNNIEYMSPDLRPVFLEEKHLIALLYPLLKDTIYLSSVWAYNANYYVDGIKIKNDIKYKINKINDLDDLRNKISDFEPTEEMLEKEKLIFENFISINKNHIDELVFSEKLDIEGFPLGADPFIRQQTEKYKNRECFVSFSAGKDSIAVSQLVRNALGNQSVMHIFGDTTLEFPTTYEYLDKFKINNNKTPFFFTKNLVPENQLEIESGEEKRDSIFLEMCDKIGPPSRVKSWCCSIFKTGPMGTTLSEMNLDLLTFYGVRRFESVSRSKYHRVSKSPKLERQIIASPVIDWMDIDIWLYILAEKLEINSAYKKGFTRVGCWCCPNNSDWSDLLTKIYFKDNFNPWHEFLIDFAKRIGKPDYIDYINDGKWKARQGGAGLDSSSTKIVAKDCLGKEDNAKTYQLTRSIDEDFFQLFKPFGELDDTFGKKKLNEIFVLAKNKEFIFKIIARKGEKTFRIVLLITNSKELNKLYPKKLGTYFWNYIDNQIKKFQTCINCKACEGVCPVSAIEITNNKYIIDERICIKCLKCVNHFDSGCLITSALGTKNEPEII